MEVYRFGYIGVNDIEEFIEGAVDRIDKERQGEGVTIKRYEDGNVDVELEAVPCVVKILQGYGYLSDEEAKTEVDYYLFYEL